MTVLFGHPAGNPNSFHAALAHYEAGWLEAFCIPWLPSPATLRVMEALLPRRIVSRFGRRSFPSLTAAPKRQGRPAELFRLLRRMLTSTDEAISYEANDWLMHTMARGARKPSVTAVHAYEDCSLDQFQAAKRMGKACIYDMPIGYYPAWEETQAALAKKYANWLPPDGISSGRYVRAGQKVEEMELADLVCVPSSFVAATIQRFLPDKIVTIAPYGVDSTFWTPPERRATGNTLRFIYAGQLSIRKGIPDLLVAWQGAALEDAELHLCGLWMLSQERLGSLPQGVVYHPPCGAIELRDLYRESDVFVFPSHFEGFGLVLLEAMSCGLPAIASRATAAPDVIQPGCGSIVDTGDINGLIDLLEWYSNHRGGLDCMRDAARARAEQFTWAKYRATLTSAVREWV